MSRYRPRRTFRPPPPSSSSDAGTPGASPSSPRRTPTTSPSCAASSRYSTRSSRAASRGCATRARRKPPRTTSDAPSTISTQRWRAPAATTSWTRRSSVSRTAFASGTWRRRWTARWGTRSVGSPPSSSGTARESTRATRGPDRWREPPWRGARTGSPGVHPQGPRTARRPPFAT